MFKILFLLTAGSMAIGIGLLVGFIIGYLGYHLY